jgi:hypothetical protein
VNIDEMKKFSVRHPEGWLVLGGREMKVISIRQPWAWLIVHGHKDIENRTWATTYRGPVLIHAAKGMTRIEYDMAEGFVKQVRPDIEMPGMQALERGGIIGIAEITDCVTASESPWFFGPKGFVLANQRVIPFIPMKGALGVFDAPVSIADAVCQALEGEE